MTAPKLRPVLGLKPNTALLRRFIFLAPTTGAGAFAKEPMAMAVIEVIQTTQKKSLERRALIISTSISLCCHQVRCCADKCIHL